MIDTKIMKKWAVEHLPRNSYLRDNILRTPDMISQDEALVMVNVWIALVDQENM